MVSLKTGLDFRRRYACLLNIPGIILFFVAVFPLHAEDSINAFEVEQPYEIRALLTPYVESTLSSQIAGKITYIEIQESERFERNQRLLEFNCDVQKAQLKKAAAQLLSAEKQLAANLRLQEYKSISQLEVEVAAAEVEKAKAEQAVVRARLKMCVIHAPFSGRVVELMVNPHESVTQGQELVKILDDSRLKLELFVPSRWLSWLRQGMDFSVRIDETDKIYPARVTALGAKVDPVSHSIEVTAEIEGRPAELLAGMSGTARFQLPN
jgi:RND family efflux transporter MFP subunit